jgi:ABC-type uncharacterized transport system substrate-binding protein
MRRREFFRLFGAGAGTLLVSSYAWPQEPGRTYRLGMLALITQAIEATRDVTFAELAKHGFVEGRNLVLDARIGGPDEQPSLARELVSRKPDVIFAISNVPVEVARQVTTTVPIVMFGDDPVRQGFAESLARPGGNVTGITILAAELDAKRLQLLHEAVPSARRVATLHIRGSGNRDASEQAMRNVAASAGLELVTFDAVGSAEYPTAFAAMRNASVQALVITAHSRLYRDGSQLAALALEAGLPTICEWADMARTGCVIGYGPSLREMRRRAGEYIARLFQGTPPSACLSRVQRISSSR